MGTITELCQQVIETSFDPKELEEIMRDPTNFKFSQKALLDAAITGKIKLEDDRLHENIPIKIEKIGALPSGKVEIQMLSKKGRRVLKKSLECKLEHMLDRDLSGSEEKRLLNIVSGKTSITYENAIMICFALGLDLEASTKFISASNASVIPFDSGSAIDTAFQLCLATGRSYSDACKIIDAYQSNDVQTPFEEGTVALRHVAMPLEDLEGEFDTPESILKYLEENRSHFLKHHENLWKTYVKYKRKLCFHLIQDQPEKFANQIRSFKTEIEKERDNTREPNMQSRIEEVSKKLDDVLNDLKTVENDEENDDARRALRTSWEAFAEDFERKRLPDSLVLGLHTSKKLISNDDLFETYGLMKVTESTEDPLPQRDMTIARQGRDENIHIRWFFEGFPYPKDLNKMDSTTNRDIPGFACRIRKTIIIFYFLDYAYKWREAENPESYGYDSFTEKLNDALNELGLAPLYPADPCEMLIMKSIFGFDPKKVEEEVPRYDPIDFFVDTQRACVKYEEND